MKHFPAVGSKLLKWAGDELEISLELERVRAGRAVFRTNIGRASIHRREVIAQTDEGTPILARDWHDISMKEVSPGIFRVRVPLLEVGIFQGKACFFPEGETSPEWPDGEDIRIKVEPAHTICANTMYTAFVRQFGPARYKNPRTTLLQEEEAVLDRCGYTVIPPSGTFRDLIAQLPMIMDTMHFRIIQLLPIHPEPTVYARMGRFGCPFASLDFFAVNPELAVFDKSATPLDQFHELVDAVHARAGFLYLDIPANHTGWSAALQTHHPEWYRHTANGEFASPGAWGVTWADLVELDFRHPKLRAYLAEVFLYWCRQGVDGFRCDAGYMIPVETWTYIVARVREEYPDTVFLLEGLGGPVETTRRLLEESDLNWAYSELFQTYRRDAMDNYLPQEIGLSERCGPLIHFAETHDNNRLAASGETFARMRVLLSALLSHQGAFGIANGVEWLATEKIDVHGASSLNWDATPNLVGLFGRINLLLMAHPAFGPHTRLRPIQTCGGEGLAVLRETSDSKHNLLVLVNLDSVHPVRISWNSAAFPVGDGLFDLLECTDHTGAEPFPCAEIELQPGQVRRLTPRREDLRMFLHLSPNQDLEPDAVTHRRAELQRLRCAKADVCTTTTFHWPLDTRRQVMIPHGNFLRVFADHPFHLTIRSSDGRTLAYEGSVRTEKPKKAARLPQAWNVLLPIAPYADDLDGTCAERRTLVCCAYTPAGVKRTESELLVLPPLDRARVWTSVSGDTVRHDTALCNRAPSVFGEPIRAFTPIHAVLSNGAGAMAYVRAAWGTIRSQYDCLLAMNLDPNVPVDKTVFWSRCRAWVRYNGFSNEVNESCLTQFSADPAGRFAEWFFHVPCGMGKWVPLQFHLELTPLRNVALLRISRPATDAEGALEGNGDICLILRPDIEWRSFHTPTKAYQGAEGNFSTATQPFADGNGFRFTPYGTEGVTMEISAGTFHKETEWNYQVPHPEEAERGLDAAGDLFSPGWFEAVLADSSSVTVSAGDLLAGKSEETDRCGNLAVNARPNLVTRSSLLVTTLRNEGRTEKTDTLPLAEAVSRAMDLYLVKRDNLKTVIAGYPWFLDWGRDTLIVLRGLVADGRTEDAMQILCEFGRFEDGGRLPNIIHGTTVGNWDTSDAPLWYCVVVEDLISALGEKAVLSQEVKSGRTIRDVVLSIVQNLRNGTENGVKMDAESGLVFSPSHFTWMDTNYPAGTPREGYPVEIQALWLAALRLVATRIDSGFQALRDRATESFARYFRMPEGGLADCLRAKPGVPAKQAEVEDAIRSNQLLAVSLDVVPQELAKEIIAVCEQLLVPGAIRSLADAPVRCNMGVWRDGVLLNQPYAPYCGVYNGDEDTRRKPAYHNGTSWTWPFPLYAEALIKVYGKRAKPVAGSLLASAVELLNRGCLCHVPEICDGDAPHLARGCSAQAWGMSELLRLIRSFSSF
ncbi:MAG: glycogen debranching enzyme N-terminal domain-containing protein [Kiritimatiellae bacterium]|nr:glycogen debranching enzyme N-terminal domain-containing protein [Kiritimatiellia bacterium]